MNKIDPAERMMDYELNHLFLSFCSFVSLMNTKKLNMANVFLLTLKDPKLRELCKRYCIIKTDHALVRVFLQFDPNLYKSKYITKFINSLKNPDNDISRTKVVQCTPKVNTVKPALPTKKKLRRPVRGKKNLLSKT